MRGSLQIKNNIYQAVFYTTDEDGRQKTIWRSTGIKAVRGNKHKAEQRMEEIKAELDNSPPDKNILFTDYMYIWLDSVKDNVDRVTYEGYKSYIDKHIRPYFTKLGLKLQDVKLSDIENYYHYKATAGRLDGKEGGLSYRTIKLHSVVLNLMFNEAVRTSIINDNPCRLAKIPKSAARSMKKVDFYTVDQCKTLLEITKGTSLHDMIYLTFIYGLRRSELMGLRWSAIDFSGGTLSINHTVVLQNVIVEKDSTKNKTSNRVYPLLDDVREILLKLKEEQSRNRIFFGDCYEENGYVFTREDGAAFYPSYPTHALEKVLKENNLPHSRWHDLRHSCASMLIAKGWQMKDISDWLGHADIGTTMNIYGHLDMAYKRNISQKLNGLLD